VDEKLKNLFIQAPCLVPPKMQAGRELVGLTVGAIAVFFYLFAINFIDYIKHFLKL
jgi:hypothetical protein